MLILSGLTAAGVFSLPKLFRNSDKASFWEDAKKREQILFDSMPARDMYLRPAMYLNRVLDRRYYPSQNYYINEEDQILQGSTAQIDPTAIADHLAMLQDTCKAQNKKFLYVLCPGKPWDDEEFRKYGIQCYRNENADVLLTNLGERNVPYLDLRPAFKELSGDNRYQWFYRSDHHWTADAGSEAARRIISELNVRCQCGLNEQAVQKESMTRSVLQEEWIGEMGIKILGPWSMRDRLVVWEPKSPGHFHLTDGVYNKEKDGGFEVFFHKELLKNNLATGGARSLYYYYMGGNDTLVRIDNMDQETGNLLIIKDSYSNVVVPYLALASAHVTIWDMRDDQEVLSYIREHPEIETVVVMYTTSFSVKGDANDFR